MFPGPVVTEHHEPVAWKQHECLLLPFWRPEVCSQGMDRATLRPEAPGEDPPASSCFWRPRASLGSWPHPSRLRPAPRGLLPLPSPPPFLSASRVQAPHSIFLTYRGLGMRPDSCPGGVACLPTGISLPPPSVDFGPGGNIYCCWPSEQQPQQRGLTSCSRSLGPLSVSCPWPS